jgi:hypothetical protein
MSSRASVGPLPWLTFALIIYVCAGLCAGPIEAASNTETSVMQAIQEAIIAAAAEDATAAAAAIADAAAMQQHSDPTITRNSTSTDPQPTKGARQTAAEPQSSPSSSPASAAAAAVCSNESSSAGARLGSHCGGLVLDRTDRLGSSVGKLVWTVEQLNDIPHGASIMLMAGKAGGRGAVART